MVCQAGGAVAALVIDDDLKFLRQSADLVFEVQMVGRQTMNEYDGFAVAVNLVVEIDAIAGFK